MPDPYFEYIEQEAHLDRLEEAQHQRERFREAPLDLDDLDDEDKEVLLSCPCCGGPAGVIGVLAYLVHYLCRDCGLWFSRERLDD